MAFDQPTRNRLARFVSDCRGLLVEEFTRQLQLEYGLDPSTGEVTDITKLRNVDASHQETGRILRELMDHYIASAGSDKVKAQRETLDRIVREQAFTVLNRLCAIRMAEARGFVVEAVGKAYDSKGFQLYAQVSGTAVGETGDAYRHFLYSLFDECAVDLPVLFDRFSPQARLFPRESVLRKVLDEINHPDIDRLWAEDETIGWIYQYYNDPEERKKMRDPKQGGSAAPRNSRELAVRNQFFTPRYVVQFLTDNTLGRIWYEMTGGKTRLRDKCQYLVRRPSEVFLKPGEQAPSAPAESPVSEAAAPKTIRRKSKGDGNQNQLDLATPSAEEGARATAAPLTTDGDIVVEVVPPASALTQEELLHQPVYIPHRPLKDPRTILMLDPACGSMHFGLYSFDLFEIIYEEGWELEETLGAGALSRPAGMESLHETYATKDAFLMDVPRLIIEHNIHGIDIDPRCVQIAGLSLWLRAHRAWQGLGLRPAARPCIQRSNVVCAEPMPGEKAMLRDFVERYFPVEERGVFLRLLAAIFDKMELAGEAGSLLKIEEEIRSSIDEARDAWQKLQNRPAELFSTAELNAIRKQPELDTTADLRPLTSDFWETAENRLVAALRDYAEQAENGGGFQRRLFAEDAARGFAFIDVCRKRYDVVEMNPPFGEFSRQWKEQSRKMYPLSSNDILAAFVDGSISRLEPFGLLGAITSRTCFFLLSFQEWRENVILRTSSPVALVDLGHGVMDAAMVEAAAYVLQKSPTDTPIVCIRLLSETDKDVGLRTGVDAVRANSTARHVFSVMPKDFRKVPGSPFCYWVGSHVRELFERLPPFDSAGREAKQGLATGEDFRFVRAWWEVPPGLLVRLPAGSSQQAYQSETRGRVAWCPFAKGGTFSPFYQDLNLVVRWTDDGNEIRNFADPETGYIYSRYRGAERYFETGFTYADRASSRFAARILPEGVIISVKGSGIYCGPNEDSWPALSILNSSIFTRLMDLLLGTVELAKSYQVNTVGRVPWPTVSSENARHLHESAHDGWRLSCVLDRADVTSHAFHLPALLAFDKKSVAAAQNKWALLVAETAKRLEEVQSRIDRAVLAGYGLSEADMHAIEQASSGNIQDQGEVEGEDNSQLAIEAFSLAVELPEYTVGCAFGRWDIRDATGEKAVPELPDPFAPLPMCPPGMLQNVQGLPARPEDVPSAYPVRIPWDGILVDDPNHPLDIERRGREVIEIIWGAEARSQRSEDRSQNATPESIEHEACEILGVESLRDYFRKAASFFADHLKRYSKSRRQAPIYWPLSTAKGSYTLWVYYHRLTDQTLYTCLNEFVERKLKQVVEDGGKVRAKTVRSSGEEKELEELSDLEAELKDFRDELLRLAKFWKPNLNDGVQITAAPLWKFFLHRPWRAVLKETWEKLEAGEYDWAHLALSVWPDRVVKASHKDRSFAIAHDLESGLWEEVEVEKKSRGGKVKKVKEWRPRALTEAQLNNIVAAVKVAKGL